MKTSRLLFWLLILALSAFAFGLDSCVTRPRPAPNEGPRVMMRLDTTANAQKTGIPPTYAGSAGIARLTDALGLSTPAGRERRQQRKDAAATVPRTVKVKDGAFSWNGDAVAIGKKAGPVTSAGAGATVSVTAIGKNKGAAATAPGATATNTVSKPGFPWLKVGGAVGGVLLLVLLVGTPAGPWLWGVLFRRRRENDSLIS